MIKINQQQNNQISFRGIKPTIRIGEQAIREFQMEFPALKSSSMTATRLLHAKDLPNTKALQDKILALAYQQEASFEHLRIFSQCKSFQDYIYRIPPLIKKYGVANCDEMALITQYNLLKKGIKSNITYFIIKNKKKGIRANLISFFAEALTKDNFQRLVRGHMFIVMNMTKEAPHSNPKQWKSKTVIVDPWIGKCGPAHEMIAEYERLFRIDQKKEYLDFYKWDVFNVDTSFKPV